MPSTQLAYHALLTYQPNRKRVIELLRPCGLKDTTHTTRILPRLLNKTPVALRHALTKNPRILAATGD